MVAVEDHFPPHDKVADSTLADPRSETDRLLSPSSDVGRFILPAAGWPLGDSVRTS